MNETFAVEQLSYEQAYQELEGIVSALEIGDHTLEESMELFARGQALVKHCTTLLDQAELRVQQLIGENLTEFSPSP
jgi:exodeoxyribonuclease VII small subunit